MARERSYSVVHISVMTEALIFPLLPHLPHYFTQGYQPSRHRFYQQSISHHRVATDRALLGKFSCINSFYHMLRQPLGFLSAAANIMVSSLKMKILSTTGIAANLGRWKRRFGGW